MISGAPGPDLYTEAVATRPSYPVALLLEGRSCLVVGGGRVAHRKAVGLLDAGAVVTVVAPEVLPELEALRVRIERRRYLSGEVAGYHLCCTATGDRDVDGAVASDAAAAGVLVNAADDLENCSFILPAIRRWGPVSVAVSTDGASPALSVWLRDRLAGALTTDPGRLAALASAARAALRTDGIGTEGLDWAGFLDSLEAALRPGTTTDPDAVVSDFLERVRDRAPSPGRGGAARPSG